MAIEEIVKTHLSSQVWGKKNSCKQILLIHGWGMNSAVWKDTAAELASCYPEYLIKAVDLPGYGHSIGCSIEHLNGIYTARSLAHSLLHLMQEKQTIIMAWSMGGLVAIELAALLSAHNDTTQLLQLILISSTPCFVQLENWPDAVPAALFESFYTDLIKDHQATLKRFLAIQAMGSKTARQDIKYLYQQLYKRGEPDAKALEYGLDMLLKEDKREQLHQISTIPISLICGERDTLVNLQGQEQLTEQQNITLYKITTAGHAPFISHPEEFFKILHLCIPVE